MRLVVSDNGHGIHPDTIGSVFEPFVTDSRGKASRGETEPEEPHRGTGLGLSITRVIVHDHGGELTAHSDGLGKGSRFVVDLPRATTPEG